MKKLNITKKQYDESKYFTKKYGTLKFVSESGKLYKTDKGVVIALESLEDFKADDEEKKEDEPKAGDDADKGGDSADVTRGELTEMLKDVVSDIETVCDKQDLSFEDVAGIEKPEGESEEGADADEVVATKEEVAEVLAGVIEKVTAVADKNGVELPIEIEKKDDEEGAGDGEEKKDDEEKSDLDKARDGELEITDEENEEVCPTCGAKKPMKKECGDGTCECGDKGRFKMESVKKARRARLVREAIARRRRARKIRESIQKRIRARKVMESIRARRRAKVMESIRAQRRAKVMESIRRRRAAKRVAESRNRVARKAK